VLFGCQLKDEVRRESFPIALDLLVENSHRYAIKLGNIGVEDYPLVAQKQDARFHSGS
jgi:hypothetical protein